MDTRHTDLYKNKIVVLVAFTGISLLLFSSSTARIFLSDDYCTLHYIVANNSFLLPSFFRPLGDLTLKWTYQLAGLDPFYFYLVNILLHAVNSYLVYLFCLKWFANENRVHLFAIIAGLVFLTYPSHAEAIFWAIGRGISLATFFSLLAMITFVSGMSITARYILVCLLYFMAMACYESAVMLPFVLFAMLGTSSRRRNFIWTILLLATLFIHIFLRYQFTGGVWQAYNGIILSKDIIQYLSAFIKIILRLFIPPFNQPLLFTISGIIALIIVFLIIFRNRKKFETDGIFIRTILFVITGLVATILVSISFGMSTRTSEGDRLMYLPSVFYAILISLLIVRLVTSIRTIALATFLLLAFQIVFLMINQHNWIRASVYAIKVINAISAHSQRPLYIINLPSDNNGAYVFRNCLPEALMHYQIDTAGVKVVNIIQSTELEKMKTLIVPDIQGENFFIWPSALLVVKSGIVMSVNGDTTQRRIPVSSFLFWNKKDLVPVSP